MKYLILFIFYPLLTVSCFKKDSQSSIDTNYINLSETLSNISITKFIAPANSLYGQGGEIIFQVQFSEKVYLSGSPKIKINIGTTTKYAELSNTENTETLEFKYTVANGDNDLDGITIQSKIFLDGGSITDSTGRYVERDVQEKLGDLSGITISTIQDPPDQILTVVAAPSQSDTELNISWPVPNDNGTPIVDYLIQFKELNASTWIDFNSRPATNDATITGLTSGLTYQIRVAANNGVTGPFSVPTSVEIFSILNLEPVAWLSSTNITDGGAEPSHGDRIAQWNDITGFATNATESDTSRQPLYQTNIQGGLPAVRFNNLDRGLQGTFTRVNGTDLTFVVVGQFDLGSTDKALFEFSNGGSARGFFIDRRYASNIHYSPSITMGAFNIWIIQDSGGSAIVHENTTEIFNNTTSFNTDFIGTGNYVLGDDTTGGNRLNGYIGEFLVFDKALNSTDISKLRAYLKNKWSI